MPPLGDVTGLNQARIDWRRIDALLVIERARIRRFVADSYEQHGPGAVLVRIDDGPGAPLEWLLYDPAALRAIGIHHNRAEAQTMRCNLNAGLDDTMQPVLFVDRCRQFHHGLFWHCRRGEEVPHFRRSHS